MGHLVNANAFRLGWHTTWSNFWYSQIKFGYSNFVFLCVRLRAFLRFFFFHRAMDKSLFIFSHFEIIKNFKFLYIRIFGYFNSLLIFMPKIFKFLWKFMKRWRARFFRALRNHLTTMFYSDNENNWFQNKSKSKYIKNLKSKSYLYKGYRYLYNKTKIYKRRSRKRLIKDINYKWSGFRHILDDKCSFLKKNWALGFRKNKYRKINRYNKNRRLFKNKKAHYNWIVEKNKRNNKYILLPSNVIRGGNPDYTTNSSQFLQAKLYFFSKNVLPISDYKVYFKQYPVSFGGQWWEYEFSSNKDYNKRTNCVWLFFKETQRDVSVLRSLKWKSWLRSRNKKVRLAKLLLKILNKREQQIDFFLDGITTNENKFSFISLEFIDALLDNMFEYLSLSKEQRIIKKLNMNVNDIIVALIYAFRCQRRFFKMWREKPFSWKRLLNKKEKLTIYNLYFYTWKGFKFRNKILSLKRYFNIRKLNLKRRKLWIRKYFNKGRSANNLSKVQLFKRFQKYFPQREHYAIFRKRVFCASLLLILNFSNYRKLTSFDMSYFNVLVKSLQSFNIKLLRKFFLLRWRTNGGLLLRTNMRQYFLLSSLLSASNDETLRFYFKRRRRSNRENYFNKYIFGIIHELFLEKYIKPIASCFTIRLADSFRKIIPNFEYFVQFYLITNNQVNAQFLARYIAKKLEYHHRLKSLLNPLKREFKYLGRITKLTFKQQMKKISQKESWKTNMKILWKSLLLILIINYEKVSRQYYNLNNLKISFELFSLMKWVNSQTLDLNRSSYFFFKLIFERRALFLWTFAQNITQHLSNFSLSFVAINFFKVITYSQFRSIFFNLVYDWFILKSCLLSDLFTPFYHSNMVYLKFGYFQYKRYLNFTYNMSSYSLFKNYNFSNNLHTRLKNIKPNQAQFLGFKIKCSGRFSRKQRASSYWFSLGSVPLNSVTATIDYSMYTVPLANSAITIKVWIHRMNTVDNLFYIHLV